MRRGFGLALGMVGALGWGALGCSVVNAVPAGESELDPDACGDGEDNDFDGRTDCYDADCVGAEACVEACTGGLDEDLDGQVDCGDDDCVDDPACVEVEESALACANGVDEDRDGLVDCLDPDCDGRCPEEAREACADGRDNDGDGRVDSADAACWPELATLQRITAERCGSLPGTRIEAPLDAVGDAFFEQFYLQRAGIEALQPVEFFLREEAVLGRTFDLGTLRPSTLGLLAPLYGAWEGTEIELLVAEDDVEIRLVPEALAGEGTPASITLPLLRVLVRPEGLEVESGDETLVLMPPLREGWGRVRLVIVDGQLTGSITPVPGLGSGEAFELPPVPAPIPPSGRLSDLRLLLSGLGQVSQLRVRIPSFDPCGETLPGPEAPLEAGADLALKTSPAGVTCALALTCPADPFELGGVAGLVDRRFVTETSVRRGLGFTPTATLPERSTAVALGWDDSAGVFRAALVSQLGEVSFQTSEDCVTWTPAPVSRPPTLSPRYSSVNVSCQLDSTPPREDTISYVIDGARHEIYYRADDDAGPLLVRAVSEDGGQTFDRAEIPFPGFAPRGAMIRVAAIGNERVITRIEDVLEVDGDDSVGLGVRFGVGFEDGRYVELPLASAFRPSRIPGTYDRDTIRVAAPLVPSEPGEGTLLEVGVGAVGEDPRLDERALGFVTGSLRLVE
ncbi:MAG: hypothetical protein AAF447_12475 [Myxococcota bacterium]